MNKRDNVGGKYELVPHAAKAKKGQVECVNTSSRGGKH